MAEKIAEAPRRPDFPVKVLDLFHRTDDRTFPCGNGRIVAVEKEAKPRPQH